MARAERPPSQGPPPIRDADNTGLNERDASGATQTPMDQSNQPTDIELTRQIRRSLTADPTLSMDAKNVKVVAKQGVVTLRGPVESPEEKASVVSMAKEVQGVKRVDDQLEVERKP
jgi:osmotically-inducible protein OsmY